MLFVLQCVAAVLDPLILRLFLRMFAREESESAYWRCFTVNLILVSAAGGVAIWLDSTETYTAVVGALSVVVVASFITLLFGTCIRPGTAAMVTLAFLAYKGGFAAFAMNDPDPAVLLGAHFPIAQADTDFLAMDWWFPEDD